MSEQNKLSHTGTRKLIDMPRERMLRLGMDALSDQELITILLGSGGANHKVTDLSDALMKSVNYDLFELARLEIQELKRIPGIGLVKAINIAVSFELGKRKARHTFIEKPSINSSSDAFQIVAPSIESLRHEEFWIVLLNRANRVLKTKCISSGGTEGTVVDVKMIFKIAIDHLASSIIVCHNHPSGNLSPSGADLNLTKRIESAGELLGIRLLDHLIISHNGYYSFADEGKL